MDIEIWELPSPTAGYEMRRKGRILKMDIEIKSWGLKETCKRLWKKRKNPENGY